MYLQIFMLLDVKLAEKNTQKLTLVREFEVL